MRGPGRYSHHHEQVPVLPAACARRDNHNVQAKRPHGVTRTRSVGLVSKWSTASSSRNLALCVLAALAKLPPPPPPPDAKKELLKACSWPAGGCAVCGASERAVWSSGERPGAGAGCGEMCDCVRARASLCVGGPRGRAGAERPGPADAAAAAGAEAWLRAGAKRSDAKTSSAWPESARTAAPRDDSGSWKLNFRGMGGAKASQHACGDSARKPAGYAHGRARRPRRYAGRDVHACARKLWRLCGCELHTMRTVAHSSACDIRCGYGQHARARARALTATQGDACRRGTRRRERDARDVSATAAPWSVVSGTRARSAGVPPTRGARIEPDAGFGNPSAPYICREILPGRCCELYAIELRCHAKAPIAVATVLCLCAAARPEQANRANCRARSPKASWRHDSSGLSGPDALAKGWQCKLAREKRRGAHGVASRDDASPSQVTRED